MKYAVVDIGSNTVRINLYIVDEDGLISSVMSKKTVAGLATYVEDGYMSKKGADKLVRILQDYNKISEAFASNKILIIATASLRNIENSQEILEYVQASIGLPIFLVSGPDEARYGLLGISSDYSINNAYIIDIGGGSTEVTLVKDQEILYSGSMDFGSLSLYKKFCQHVFPSKAEAKKMEGFVRGQLSGSNIPRIGQDLNMYGLGGTVRAAGNLSQELYDLAQNNLITQDQVQHLKKSLLEEDRLAVRTLLQVVPERVHTIVPGLVILNELLKYTSCSEIQISTKGLREGVLLADINKH